MKTWIESKDGSQIKYRLNKELYPVWYATVFMHDGMWTFEFGRRIKENDPSREHYSYANIKKWKSLATAKTKALTEIRLRGFDN